MSRRFLAYPVNEAFMSLSESGSLAPQRRFPFVSWSCALSPFALLLVFLAFGVHIRLGIGHWPIPMIENYHSTAFSIHEWVLMICVWFSLFVAGPLWLICLLLRSLRPAWPRTVVSQLVTCAAGWLAIFAVLTFDPTTFSAWFLD